MKIDDSILQTIDSEKLVTALKAGSRVTVVNVSYEHETYLDNRRKAYKLAVRNSPDWKGPWVVRSTVDPDAMTITMWAEKNAVEAKRRQKTGAKISKSRLGNPPASNPKRSGKKAVNTKPVAKKAARKKPVAKKAARKKPVAKKSVAKKKPKLPALADK